MNLERIKKDIDHQTRIEAYENNRTQEEKEKDEFFKRIHVDMPDYKLTKMDDYGFKFEPIEKER